METETPVDYIIGDCPHCATMRFRAETSIFPMPSGVEYTVGSSVPSPLFPGKSVLLGNPCANCNKGIYVRFTRIQPDATELKNWTEEHAENKRDRFFCTRKPMPVTQVFIEKFF